MNLTVRERILLLGIMPKESNFITLKIIRDLESKLGFSEDELKEFGIKIVDTQITWTPTDKIFDIAIGEKACDIISGELKKLSQDNKLTKDYLDLYEKFVKE